MKKMIVVSKYIGLTVAGLFLLCNIPAAQAASGWCQTTTGTQKYVFNFNKTFTDPSQNQANSTIENAYSWSLGDNYTVQCDCTTRPTTYFKTDIPSALQFEHQANGLNYYKLNEYLAIATRIYIYKNGQMATPFTDMSNATDNGTVGCDSPSTNAVSGSDGQLSLYFIRPFVGEVTIPLTTVANLYASTVSGSYSNIPIASVAMQGSVTVPQNCTINAGQAINIDFGDIKTTDISTKGTSSVTEKQISTTLKCSNISDGVKVTLSFKGTNDSNDNTALATSNNDIGIQVKNSNHAIVTPNQDELPVEMDYSAQQGTTTMYLSPINTTGSVPATGGFTAIATLNAEIQ